MGVLSLGVSELGHSLTGRQEVSLLVRLVSDIDEEAPSVLAGLFGSFTARLPP